jgi:hypothetical protein
MAAAVPEHPGPNAFLDGGRCDAACTHEDRLRRLVMVRVERAQRGVVQAGYHQGIATRIGCVRRAGKQVAGDAAPQRMHGIGESAFHFVEHHALEGQLPILEHVTPPFLQKIQVVQRWKETCIQVDVEQVEKILPVRAGKQIGRAIGLGPRVHVRRERTAQHRKEGRTHREVP